MARLFSGAKHVLYEYRDLSRGLSERSQQGVLSRFLFSEVIHKKWGLGQILL